MSETTTSDFGTSSPAGGTGGILKQASALFGRAFATIQGPRDMSVLLFSGAGTYLADSQFDVLLHANPSVAGFTGSILAVGATKLVALGTTKKWKVRKTKDYAKTLGEEYRAEKAELIRASDAYLYDQDTLRQFEARKKSVQDEIRERESRKKIARSQAADTAAGGSP